MNQTFNNSKEVLRLLDGVSDSNRVKIIFLLGQAKSMNVGDITTRFHISRPAISHHLKVLKDAGIVRSEKIGQEIYYQLDRKVIVDGLRKFADALDHCCSDQPPK
jgi:ArsR family transcriptional regulator, arsenate/arsenite/antimonite-responsive transcriptional repressor